MLPGACRHCPPTGVPHPCQVVSPSRCVSTDCPGLRELHEQQQARGSLRLPAAEPRRGRGGVGLPCVLVHRGTVTAQGPASGVEGHLDWL